MLQMLITSVHGKRKAVFSATGLRKQEEKKLDLVFLKDLIVAGSLKPVVDRSYPLEKLSEAHSYVEQGHKKGSVIITVDH
jgi:NADPH:quinone reductase-like Zn-dependent oxidoreductase